MKQIFIFALVIFLLFISLVIAIPYPGGTRCRLYGGELNQTNNLDCILSSGIHCNPMGDAEDNWAGNCGDYASMPCAELGIGPTVNECCDGLVSIRKKQYFDAFCVWNPPTGYMGVCSNCGDGICDSDIETKCNCPKDCSVNFFYKIINWFKSIFN